MSSTSPQSTVQSRQTRQRFANPEDYLSYELGKAVQELPPLYTRVLAGTLTALVFGAIAWAHFSKVDEVATTQGELIPSQQIRPVQALEAGKLREVRVQEGDRVQAGQILIEQDTTVPQTVVERLRESVKLLRQDIDRLEAERTGQTTTGVTLQDELLTARLNEFDNKQAAARAETNRLQASITEARTRLVQLQENLFNARKTLANAQERERSLRTLVDPNNGAVPRFDYLQAKDQLTEAQDRVSSLQQEIAGQRASIRQAEAAAQAAQQTAGRLTSERQSEILSQLNQRRQDLTSLEGQLAQASKQQEQETIRAPISGTVYNLRASLAEGTVQPGKELLSILPEGNNLVLEVKVLNRDIGFISTGMRAKVKLVTFPFQEFGTIDGEVIQISPNATVDQNLGLVFTARIRLSRNTMNVKGQEVRLVPGMAATAEIVTRQRSILSFLLEPITRRFDEAFQVR